MVAIPEVKARLDKIDALHADILRESENLRKLLIDAILRDSPASIFFTDEWRATTIKELEDLDELVGSVQALIRPIRRAYRNRKTFLIWTEMEKERTA